MQIRFAKDRALGEQSKPPVDEEAKRPVLGGMKMNVVDTTRRLTGQPRRIVVIDVVRLTVKEVEDLDAGNDSSS
jgi:hypothetical protein